MALNSNPQATVFCNTKIRRYAELAYQLYQVGLDLQQEWFSQGLGSVIPNDASQLDDGALQDGRPIATGIAVNNIVNRATEFTSDLQAASNAKLNTISALVTARR